MQPLLLHSHPLQLCRLSMHGLELVSGGHLRNLALQLSWICSSYGNTNIKNTKLEELDSRRRLEVWAVSTLIAEITNQTVGGAASHGREADR